MSLVELALADQPLADAQQHAHQRQLGLEHARLPLLGRAVGWTFREPDGQLVFIIRLARVGHAPSVGPLPAGRPDRSRHLSRFVRSVFDACRQTLLVLTQDVIKFGDAKPLQCAPAPHRPVGVSGRTSVLILY